MSIRGDDIAARARGLIGMRFRPQGRDPMLGLDCVGVAAAAAGVPAERLPADYDLRGEHLALIEHELCDLGCVPVPEGEAEAGDVVVCEVGPAQFHVLLCTGPSFIHADAGLRLVVERPRPFPWPVAGVWRPAGGE
ncbi:MAG: peptidoglycan endopeptidase [Alphaproteobacteria bacterium]|nr:peptidoglycan endopeptidase [Alphaproteobacteria bacterium]MBV9371121.1 peptidoglycan endopeptidase [Alphaproteobacteria bacterium]MBV9900773.1 peptidoglycan endopeptidase [Alphaproteobacteria bacterium]